jgi:hypothetical protein
MRLTILKVISLSGYQVAVIRIPEYPAKKLQNQFFLIT